MKNYKISTCLFLLLNTSFCFASTVTPSLEPKALIGVKTTAAITESSATAGSAAAGSTAAGIATAGSAAAGTAAGSSAASMFAIGTLSTSMTVSIGVTAAAAATLLLMNDGDSSNGSANSVTTAGK